MGMSSESPSMGQTGILGTGPLSWPVWLGCPQLSERGPLWKLLLGSGVHRGWAQVLGPSLGAHQLRPGQADMHTHQIPSLS